MANHTGAMMTHTTTKRTSRGICCNRPKTPFAFISVAPKTGIIMGGTTLGCWLPRDCNKVLCLMLTPKECFLYLHHDFSTGSKSTSALQHEWTSTDHYPYPMIPNITQRFRPLNAKNQNPQTTYHIPQTTYCIPNSKHQVPNTQVMHIK